MTTTNDPLYQYTLAEIVQHLEKRGFDTVHIVDIGEDSWGIEHPLRCRILQYDELAKTMRTLRDTCAVWHAFDYGGLAARLRDRRGIGRYRVDRDAIEELQQLEGVPPTG